MLSSFRALCDGPHPLVRLGAESIVTALSLIAFAWAWRADFAWSERHVVMPYWEHDAMAGVIARNWRIAAVGTGAILLLGVRPVAGRWAGRAGARGALASAGRVLVAAVLALLVSEGVLRGLHRPRPGALHVDPQIGQPDARYGWGWRPSSSKVGHQFDRAVEYAINAEGNRARSIADAPDPSLPTLLFAGESITLGHGLAWEETYPALVGQALGLQVVILAAGAYGSDQVFLRLADTLPRFAHPVAVVTLFMPAMLWRMTLPDHPHLGFDAGAPTLHDPRDFWRDLELANLWRDAIRYDSDAPVVLGGAIARETARRARERGAKVLFVRPYFDVASDDDLLNELFRGQGIPVVGVPVGSDLLPGDAHPNVRSARRIAQAILAALATEGAS